MEKVNRINGIFRISMFSLIILILCGQQKSVAQIRVNPLKLGKLFESSLFFINTRTTIYIDSSFYDAGSNVMIEAENSNISTNTAQSYIGADSSMYLYIEVVPYRSKFNLEIIDDGKRVSNIVLNAKSNPQPSYAFKIGAETLVPSSNFVFSNHSSITVTPVVDSVFFNSSNHNSLDANYRIVKCKASLVRSNNEIWDHVVKLNEAPYPRNITIDLTSIGSIVKPKDVMKIEVLKIARMNYNGEIEFIDVKNKSFVFNIK